MRVRTPDVAASRSSTHLEAGSRPESHEQVQMALTQRLVKAAHDQLARRLGAAERAVESPPTDASTSEASIDEDIAELMKKLLAEEEDAVTSQLVAEWQPVGPSEFPIDLDGQLLAQASPSAVGAPVSSGTTTTVASAGVGATGTAAVANTAALVATPSLAPLAALAALGGGGGGGGGAAPGVSNPVPPDVEPDVTPPVVALGDIHIIGMPSPHLIQIEGTNVFSGDDDAPTAAVWQQDGRMVVVWHGRDEAGGLSVFVQPYSAEGYRYSDPVRLQSSGHTNVDARLAVLGDEGRFVVAWTGTDPHGQSSIMVQTFNTMAQPEGSPSQFKALPNSSDADAQLCVLDATGRYVLSWTFDAHGIAYQIVEPDGQTGALLLLDDSPSNDSVNDSPKLTVLDAEGHWAAVWRHVDATGSISVRAQTFDGQGAPMGSWVDLPTSSNVNDAAFNVEPQIAAVGSDGQFVVVWSAQDRQGDEGVSVQLFGADGVAQGDPVVFQPWVEANGRHWVDPQVSALGTEGDYVVTWSGENSKGDARIYAQAFDANGLRRGGLTALEGFTPAGGGNHSPQVVSYGEDGRYVITWVGLDHEGDASIFVQSFGADGQASGPLHCVEGMGNTQGWDDAPQITAEPQGGFVLTWSGPDGGGDRSIFVMRFDVEGQPESEAYGAFQVVTVTYDPTTNTDVFSVVADFSQLGGPAQVAAEYHNSGEHAGLWVATHTLHNNTLPYTHARVSLTVTDTSGNATTQTDGALLTVSSGAIYLGEHGQLIAPAKVNGQWYWVWDRNGDGAINTDSSPDTTRYDDDLSNSEALALLFGTDRSLNLYGVEVVLPSLEDAQAALNQIQGLGYARDLWVNGRYGVGATQAQGELNLFLDESHVQVQLDPPGADYFVIVKVNAVL